MLNPVYSSLDYALADFLTDRCGFVESERRCFNALALTLSAAQNEGHSCIQLQNEEVALLKTCRVVFVASVEPGLQQTEKPLVLENNRLYFNRYWRYETRLVRDILSLIKHSVEVVDCTELLDKYFPPQADNNVLDEVDWQREAAESAASHSFTIITGGPGTGKTTTVLKILAMLQELNEGELVISLAAPTGKAAMRLQQSLVEGKQSLPLSDQRLLEAIPDSVSTLHRLLGPIRQSNHFRHNAKAPLSCDLLVVDESSMIDLAMMSKLLDALHPEARLILLGDKDQLASVESGAVLNDLCSSLQKQTIELKKTWRFSGPIKALAVAINAQQADSAWSLLSGDSQELQSDLGAVDSNVSTSVEAEEGAQYSLFGSAEDDTSLATESALPDLVENLADDSSTTIRLLDEHWMDEIHLHYQPYIDQVHQSSEPTLALAAFSTFQVLAAVRLGPYGVEGINREFEKRLNSTQTPTYLPWYHGKPIMITRNDPSLGLFNGDIGICLRDETQSALKVWFKDSNGEFRAIVPARLPQHETVYAMTIHKSQGSEFDHVMLVLPDKPVPLLSKELLYTGVTRAKKHVDIAATETVFKHTINEKVVRNSGIGSKIKSDLSGS